jgi:hypothetical protein
MEPLDDTERKGGNVEELSHGYWEYLEIAGVPEFF